VNYNSEKRADDWIDSNGATLRLRRPLSGYAFSSRIFSASTHKI